MALSSNVVTLLDSLGAVRNEYIDSKPGSRETLLELTLALLGELEIPSEFLQRTFWAEPCKSGIIRSCVETKIFQQLKDASNGITTEELTEKSNAAWDSRLIQRFMSHLAAMHVISLSGGKWHATPLSNGLAEQNFQSSIEFCYDSGMPSFYKFPEWLKHVGYQSPKSDIDGPFQYAWKTNIPFFPWLQTHPPNLANFAQFMSAYRVGKPSWFEPGFYPVEERIIQGFDASYSDVLLCDVGGGRGHDLLGLASQYPSLPGRIILQDLEAVIDSIEVANPPFEAYMHDFFTPQTVKARAYSLHSILHDWSDDEGVKILENLKPALKAGYSRVLLFEIVVSGVSPSFASTTMDMQMLAHLSTGERTEKDWKRLIERAGFEVVHIYTYPGVGESVIELSIPA